MATRIESAAQFVEHYKKSFELQEEREAELVQLLRANTRNCPACRAFPKLLTSRKAYDRLLPSGSTRHEKMLTAAVLVCGCGRCSTLYDERRQLEDMQEPNPALIQRPRTIILKLAEWWNSGAYGH